MAVEARHAKTVRHSDRFYPFTGPKPWEAAGRQFPFTEVTKMTRFSSLGQTIPRACEGRRLNFSRSFLRSQDFSLQNGAILRNVARNLNDRIT
jgi:hypothetical protein